MWRRLDEVDIVKHSTNLLFLIYVLVTLQGPSITDDDLPLNC